MTCLLFLLNNLQTKQLHNFTVHVFYFLQVEFRIVLSAVPLERHQNLWMFPQSSCHFWFQCQTLMPHSPSASLFSAADLGMFQIAFCQKTPLLMFFFQACWWECWISWSWPTPFERSLPKDLSKVHLFCPFWNHW